MSRFGCVVKSCVLFGGAVVLALAGSRPLGAQAPPLVQAEEGKLPVDISVLLDGKPFPDSDVLREPEWKPRVPEPKRVVYVDAVAAAEGNGTEARPWKDLQAALCRLQPGDRLMVGPGDYKGPFLIGGACSDGTAQAPIHVFARGAMLHGAPGKDYVLGVEKAFWYIEGPQMGLNGSPATAVLVRGPQAHDVVIERIHAYDGTGSGVVIGTGAANITVSNSHLHNLHAEAPGRSYGIEIHPGTRDLHLIRNHVHHNTSGGIHTVAGAASAGGEESAPETRIENLDIVDNKLHDDKGPAIDISGVRSARIATNKIYNYRPAGTFTGAAIVVGESFKVAIEQNHIAEATVGIQVGGSVNTEERIQHVFIHRNYMENRLTSDSTGIVAEAGRGIHIFNNILDHYATGLRLRGGRSQRAGTAVANNVFLEPTLAFDAVQIADMRVFDHNVFSVSSGIAAGQIGSQKKELADLIADGTMSKTKLVKGADLVNRDLANIAGLTLVDAGSVQEAVSQKGSAPDIGVAEK